MTMSWKNERCSGMLFAKIVQLSNFTNKAVTTLCSGSLQRLPSCGTFSNFLCFHVNRYLMRKKTILDLLQTCKLCHTDKEHQVSPGFTPRQGKISDPGHDDNALV